jgi:hypothetical protein
MTRSASGKVQSAREQIDRTLAELGDWRGETLSRMRKLIKEADPDVVEEVKWSKPSSPGVPVWSHDGIICTGESYKSTVKLTFAKGAPEGPGEALQLEPRGEGKARDRHPRGGGGGRRRVQGAHPRGGRAQHVGPKARGAETSALAPRTRARGGGASGVSGPRLVT